MQRDGFASMNELLRHPYMIERSATRGDVLQIVKGGGKNNKSRFEIGTLSDRRTEAIRAAHGAFLGNWG